MAMHKVRKSILLFFFTDLAHELAMFKVRNTFFNPFASGVYF